LRIVQKASAAVGVNVADPAEAAPAQS